ncbi:MAG: sugar transferase [Clostridia bacterium]|nr:sugar transferase [Clostridia bacterium]NCC43011.1 sugar transferase [Clostridia bacterium]
MQKKDLDQYKRMMRMVTIILILALEAVIFHVVWMQYYSARIYIVPFFRKGDYYVTGLYLIFMLLFLYIYGGLKIGYMKKKNTIYSQALSGICANVLIYLVIVLLYRHIAPITPLIIMTVIQVIMTAVISVCFEALYNRCFPPRRMLLIYDTPETEQLFPKLQSRKDKFFIAAACSMSEGMEVIMKKIPEYEGVVISDVHSAERNQLLKYCYQLSIRVYVTPKISDVILRSSEMLHLFDTPLLLARNYGLTFEQKLVKRLLDLVVSVIMTIVASPFMLISAIAIKLYDGGPVLFKQKRYTIDRKEFYVYKFRSMIVDAEKDGVARLASKNDSRITPVGEILRKTRLDELPQLFNILKGDMSLVGPRPERPEIAVEYEKEIPEFAFRLKVKAGLTGYAQVYGKYNTTAYDKLKLDLMYIENYSLISDLKLLIVTFKIMFMKESTEGVEADQVLAVTNLKKEEKK